MQNIHKLNHILWLKQTHVFEYAQLPSKWTLLELCLEMHQFLRAPKLFSRRHISISKIFAAKRKMRDSVIWYFQLVLHQIWRLQREGRCNNFILQSLWKCGRKKRDFAWTLSENASIFAGAEIISRLHISIPKIFAVSAKVWTEEARLGRVWHWGGDFQRGKMIKL